jgi:hypothetical protein
MLHPLMICFFLLVPDRQFARASFLFSPPPVEMETIAVGVDTAGQLTSWRRMMTDMADTPTDLETASFNLQARLSSFGENCPRTFVASWDLS